MKAAWVAIVTLFLTVFGIVFRVGHWRGTVEERLAVIQQPGGTPIGERIGKIEERSVEVIRRLDRIEGKLDRIHVGGGNDGRVEFSPALKGVQWNGRFFYVTNIADAIVEASR